jgi:sirohydrochlorin cobaltochelatase
MAALDMPDPTTTGVVLLGRGSSDRGANGDMAKMARWLRGGDHELVDLAFTGITFPRLERVVQRQAHRHDPDRGAAVLPLHRHADAAHRPQVEHLRAQYPQIRFALGTHFGFEPRSSPCWNSGWPTWWPAARTSALSCDGCRFREIAHAWGMGTAMNTHGQAHACHDHAPVVMA